MNPQLEITIRRANSDDVTVVTDFNCRLAAETEDRTLDVNIVREGVRRGLTVGDEVSYYVAESAETVIGQLMLTREWSDWRNGWMVWLQSVYVVEEFRGRGVFRLLLETVRQELAVDDDVVGLRLYVENENAAAIATYGRLGFAQPGYRVMEMTLGRS